MASGRANVKQCALLVHVLFSQAIELYCIGWRGRQPCYSQLQLAPAPESPSASPCSCLVPALAAALVLSLSLATHPNSGRRKRAAATAVDSSRVVVAVRQPWLACYWPAGSSVRRFYPNARHPQPPLGPQLSPGQADRRDVDGQGEGEGEGGEKRGRGGRSQRVEFRADSGKRGKNLAHHHPLGLLFSPSGSLSLSLSYPPIPSVPFFRFAPLRPPVPLLLLSFRNGRCCRFCSRGGNRLRLGSLVVPLRCVPGRVRSPGQIHHNPHTHTHTHTRLHRKIERPGCWLSIYGAVSKCCCAALPLLPRHKCKRLDPSKNRTWCPPFLLL